MVRGMTAKPIFIIQTRMPGQVIGTFDTGAETKEAALRKARALSDRDYLVADHRSRWRGRN